MKAWCNRREASLCNSTVFWLVDSAVESALFSRTWTVSWKYKTFKYSEKRNYSRTPPYDHYFLVQPVLWQPNTLLMRPVIKDKVFISILIC